MKHIAISVPQYCERDLKVNCNYLSQWSWIVPFHSRINHLYRIIMAFSFYSQLTFSNRGNDNRIYRLFVVIYTFSENFQRYYGYHIYMHTWYVLLVWYITSRKHTQIHRHTDTHTHTHTHIYIYIYIYIYKQRFLSHKTKSTHSTNLK